MRHLILRISCLKAWLTFILLLYHNQLCNIISQGYEHWKINVKVIGQRSLWKEAFIRGHELTKVPKWMLPSTMTFDLWPWHLLFTAHNLDSFRQSMISLHSTTVHWYMYINQELTASQPLGQLYQWLDQLYHSGSPFWEQNVRVSRSYRQVLLQYTHCIFQGHIVHFEHLVQGRYINFKVTKLQTLHK